MEPIRCYCGFPISNIFEAYKLMSQIYLEERGSNDVNINYNMLNPQTDVNREHIFKALGLEEKKICCKTRFVTCVQFHDLEVQDRI
jgi:DNA-directed RNA polymerase subunit N (RpoN/RPB10)